MKIYEKMTNEKYHQYFEAFNPVDYDPKTWAKSAKKAGMKYVVLTAKHHDGFCLFDSKYTEFKSTNTAIKRDLIAEYVEALREEGLKVGLYFSLIDWHHPDYPKYNDWHHPMSGVEAYSCGMATDLAKPEWGYYTQNGNVLCAHIFDQPIGPLALPGLDKTNIRRVSLLRDDSEIKVSNSWTTKAFSDVTYLEFGRVSHFTYPLPDDIDTVIKIELRQ